MHHSAQEIRQNRAPAIGHVRDLEELLKKCDGVGISGANEHSDATLRAYSKAPKIRAIHCMETQESVKVSRETTRRSEIMRALRLWPDFLVHMTQASSRTDLKLAAKKTRGIVVCPRANAVLAEGLPDIQAMNEAGCNIAIGTDNVMVNSPDMFREMDYLWKATMASSRKFMDPRHILKMATVNAGKILGILNQKNAGFTVAIFASLCLNRADASLRILPAFTVAIFSMCLGSMNFLLEAIVAFHR